MLSMNQDFPWYNVFFQYLLDVLATKSNTEDSNTIGCSISDVGLVPKNKNLGQFSVCQFICSITKEHP